MKKKVSNNFIIAGNRNWYQGRILRNLNDLKHIRDNSGMTLTQDEVAKLGLAIGFLEDIKKDWKLNYDKIRKIHKMKTYENISQSN